MKDMDLSKIKKVFFIGIGGIGISALAKMVLSRGIEVMGINDEESPKTLNPLREAGVKIFLRTVLEEPWSKDGPSVGAIDILASTRISPFSIFASPAPK